MNNAWLHSLQVPSENVEAVAALIERHKEDIEAFYAREMLHFHANHRYGSIKIGEVERRARSVVVSIIGENVCVNSVTGAIASVVPVELNVDFPLWG